jgi:hypothetical protein
MSPVVRVAKASVRARTVDPIAAERGGFWLAASIGVRGMAFLLKS